MKKYIKKNKNIFVIYMYISYLWIITELLSRLHMFSTKNISILWILALCGSVIIFRKKILDIKLITKYIFEHDKNLRFIQIICIAFCIIMGVIAVSTPPSNGDSLVYHLPRICNWIQNKSVDYYLCTDIRQNVSPVLAEYIMSNIYAIFRNDSLLNLVQWVSYCYSGYLVFCLCRKLEISRLLSYVGAILFFSMPIAVSESVTTQVDLVGVVVLLMFINLLFDLGNTNDKLSLDKYTILYVICVAGLVGIGCITKCSVCFVMIPFLVWTLIKRIRNNDSIFCLLILFLIAAVSVLFYVAPTFYRNYIWYGDIFASDYMDDIMIGTLTPRLITINLYKNYSLLIIFGKNVANLLLLIANKLSIILNVDKDANGIMHTFYDLKYSYHHDYASNPIVAYVFLIAVLWWILKIIKLIRKKTTDVRCLGYCFACIMAIFVNLFVLRFQMWGARLLLPSCALMCVVDVIFLEYIGKRYTVHDISISFLIFGLCIGSYAHSMEYQTQLPIALLEKENRNLCIMGLDECKYEEYNILVDQVKMINPNSIGYITIDPQYYLWMLLKNDKNIMKEIIVDEPYKDYTPECIVVVGDKEINSNFQYGGINYYLEWHNKGNHNEYCIFIKEK